MTFCGCRTFVCCLFFLLKKKKRSHNDRAFLLKRRLYYFKKLAFKLQKGGIGICVQCIYEQCCACWPQKLKLRAVLLDRPVSHQPEGTAQERDSWGQASQAVGKTLPLCSSDAWKAEKKTNKKNLPCNKWTWKRSVPMTDSYFEQILWIQCWGTSKSGKRKTKSGERLQRKAWQGCNQQIS